MEQEKALRSLESVLSLASDHANVLGGKLEGLLFRIQRMAHAGKDTVGVGDAMFGYDVRNFRQELRNFSQEVDSLAARLGMLARTVAYEPNAVDPARTVMRLVERLHRAVVALREQALFLQQHVHGTDYKMDACYLVQETGDIESRSQGLPTTANKILIQVSTVLEGKE